MSLKSTFLVESGEVPFASEARLFAVTERVSASVEAQSRHTTDVLYMVIR